MPRPKEKPGTERKTLSIEDQKTIKALQESIKVLEKIIDEIYKK